MKKQNLIIIFYILYFGWLFVIAQFNGQTSILNFFTGSSTLLYFIFLKERGDLLWFWAGSIVPLVFAITSFSHFVPRFDLSSLAFMPLWLPLAWGTTFVALRKLYLTISR